MKIEHKKITVIKLKGDNADNFKSALNKLINNEKVVGFKSSIYSEDEVGMLKKLYDKIK